MRTDTRRRRPAMVLATAAMALIAALALAGLAIAHGNGSHEDDDPAGTIASFDRGTGQLAIDLGDGGQIAGTVTRWTWIKDGDHCDDDGAETSRQRRGWDCDEEDPDPGERGYRHRISGDDDDRGPRHRGGGEVDDLVVGAVVEDSVMVLKDGRAFFVKIDLED